MRRSFFFLLLLQLVSLQLFAQISISPDGSPPHSSAMLDIKSSNKGVLVPRMTTAQRDAIASPAPGLLVYDSTQKTLFLFDGQQWLGLAALTPLQRPATNYVYGPDRQDTLLVGYSVSMWEQFAAVGAPYKRIGGSYTGGVYIYRNTGGVWQYFTTLTPTGNNDGANFGTSVNLKGNYLIVGAPTHKNAGNATVGAAYIYQFNGATWTLVQTIFGTTPGTDFASVVAINQFGNYAAISEPGATVSGLASVGVVKIYNKATSTFVFEADLQDDAPAANERFGTAMALSPNGQYAIVGAPSKTVNGQFSHGYVGQFSRSGSVWAQQNNYITPSEENLRLGEMVDISDSYALLSISGRNEVRYLSPLHSMWGGFVYPVFKNKVNGISLDPSTNQPYILSGNTVYSGFYDYGKIRVLSTDVTSFSNPNLLSVFNKMYVAGLPLGVNLDKPYVGAAYFDTSPQ